jgi:hypothetical protein
MKLTNTVRQAFIRAVMADVPCIDYAQMARNAVTADNMSKLPKKVAAVAPETIAQLRDWKALDAAQRKQREELESKLGGCVYSVTTRKALVSLLPEFEKYLPADDTVSIVWWGLAALVIAKEATYGTTSHKKTT